MFISNKQTNKQTISNYMYKLTKGCFFLLLVFFNFTHKFSIDHKYMATSQLILLVEKTLGTPLYIISGTNGHLCRTTDVLDSLLTCRIYQDLCSSDLQWWEASGLKSMTLTIRPQTPQRGCSNFGGLIIYNTAVCNFDIPHNYHGTCIYYI
jgi:hypothetical protein